MWRGGGCGRRGITKHFLSEMYQTFVATTAEWSKALDSGSREPGSITVSVLLVGFSALPARKSTLSGPEHSLIIWLSVHPEKGRTPRGDVPAALAQLGAHLVVNLAAEVRSGWADLYVSSGLIAVALYKITKKTIPKNTDRDGRNTESSNSPQPAVAKREPRSSRRYQIALDLGNAHAHHATLTPTHART